MIRVLQIGMIDFHGGIESFLINYYRNMDKNEIQFDFVNITNKKLCFQDEILSLGGKIYNVTSYYKHPMKYIKELKRIIKENNYEVVHCNMNSAVFLYPLIAAKLAKAKTIISHSHNSSSDKGFLKAVLHAINKHFIPLFANKYFACSNKAGAWFFSKKTMQSNKYHSINNAIELDNYVFNEKVRKEKRKELQMEDNTLVLGHVGRFNKQKNHLFLIDIFNEVQKKQPNSKLVLIGTGERKEEVEKKVNDLNLNKKVLFLGQRNDVPELMQALDVFVLPSLYEGLPLVGIEAQTSGLPCIFSDTITKELQIIDKTDFISLEAPLCNWAEEIIKYKDAHRKNEWDAIKEAGYEIKSSCKHLLEIYKER